MSKNISRREFIKGSAAGALGLAAAGILGACTESSENQTAESQSEITWEHETDVVVVGVGGAGIAAMVEAAEANCEVIGLELTEEAGGSTNICGGLITIGGGTPLQEAAGFQDTPDNYYNYLVAAGGLGIDEEQLRVFADSSLDLYDWLVNKMGVVFKPGFSPRWPEPVNYDAGLTCTGDEYSADYADSTVAVPRTCWVEGESIPPMALTGAKNGTGFFQPILRKVQEKENAQIFYETSAEHLIYDQSKNRVIGVVAMQGEREIHIKARKAVILTAGGFAMNEDMMKNYCPAYAGYPGLGTRGDDGKGIKMGMELGADTKNMNCAYTTMGLSSYYAQASGAGGPLSMGILVNQLGQRFIAEDHYYSYTPNFMMTNTYYKLYNPSYAIIDQTTYDLLSDEQKEKISSLIEAQENSIDELAEALDMPKGALQNTVEFYNRYAEKKEDVIYKKVSEYVAPISTAPFYALRNNPASAVFTTGGLRINTKAQVLSAATQEPIAGLYSAGRNASNVLAYQYAGSGISVASCYVFGRIAGQNAAAESSWE